MSEAKKTPLFDLHQRLGARMVEFAGYSMPLQYKTGIKTEHLHTREAAGLFDVSHMGQILISGAESAAALERLIPIDLGTLAIDEQKYGLLLNPDGGILDDLIVTRRSTDSFSLVVNAGCKQADIEHLQQHLPENVKLEHHTNLALLALQGPAAHTVIESEISNLHQLTFMHAVSTELFGYPCRVSRCGYTGEDGFEISIEQQSATALAEKILQHPAVAPVGLGARDSLRLEAGLCLYGHDMDATTTAIEAGLKWSISKTRRPGESKAGGYLGADVIESQINSGAEKTRVGILIDGRAPAREGAVILDAAAEKEIGRITSGGFSPCLEQPVAMGFIATAYAKAGTKITIQVRKRTIDAVIHKLPFTPLRFFRG